MSDTNLQKTFDNFDYVPNDYDEDLESIAFAGSLTSESVARSIESDNNNDLLNYNIKMPFLFNNDNFERAREFVKKDVNKDISLLKDINYNTDFDTKIDINTPTSIFDSESITLRSTYGNEYFIKNATNASELLSNNHHKKKISSSIPF
ncbi:14077_t:CDS:2 [Funneliformis geosporum]|nr:14077_t:CDS:2 [Funneliformis geosporum]